MNFLVDCPHCATRVLPMAGRVCPACRRNVDAPPDPEPTPEEVVRQVYHHAVEQLREGVSPTRIEESLNQSGMDAGDAAVVVGQLRAAQSRRNRVNGQKNMLGGVLWVVGGLVFSVWTYQVAVGAGGGSYVLAWGAMLCGVAQFFRGLLQMSKS